MPLRKVQLGHSDLVRMTNCPEAKCLMCLSVCVCVCVCVYVFCV